MLAAIFLWALFDTPITSDRDYTNPLWDAEVRVHFIAPSGKDSTVDAFWDGGWTWRARFSPDETGEWRWRSECSDARNTGLHAREGTFRCEPYTGDNPLHRHGAIRLSDDRRHLVHADGAPFFWLADTAWNGVLRSRDADWLRYLDARKEQKFSAIQFVSTEWRGGRETLGGRAAYSGGEHIQIHPEFFQPLDRKVAAINEHGLLAAPVILWAIGPTDPGQALPEADTIRLARYIVARWGAHHVAWILAGDGDYSGEKAERWKRIGRAVFGDRHDRLVTMHPAGQKWVGDEFTGEPWFDFLGYQSGHGDSDRHLAWLIDGPPAKWWRSHRAIPVINLEPNYEAHPAYQSRRAFTDSEVRRAAYWSLLITPTAGVTFGHNSIWVWNGQAGPAEGHKNLSRVEPWNAGVDTPGTRSMTALRNFFESIAWWRLRPSPDLLVPAGKNETPARFVAAARDEGGQLAVVYLPAGGEIALDASKLKLPALASWFDPRTGERRALGRISGPSPHFAPPDERDWLLVCESQ